MIFTCVYFVCICSTCIKKACAYKQAFTVGVLRILKIQFWDFLFAIEEEICIRTKKIALYLYRSAIGVFISNKICKPLSQYIL